MAAYALDNDETDFAADADDQREVMSAEDLQGIVEAEVSDAVAFIDSDIGRQRAEAIHLYRGDLSRTEAEDLEGRSKFVSRDVADTIHAILPSLMRVFFGPEHVVEFVPENQEDEPVAAQQTDYINYIVTRDNPGFEIFYAVLKNALREKLGIIKWWWDDSIQVSTKLYTGLDMDGLTKLLEDIQSESTLEAELIEQEQREDGTLDVKLKLKRRCDRARIEAVPPEEFLINRDAKSIDGARLVAHRRDMTVSDLVALGYDRDLVEMHAGQDEDMARLPEAIARNPFTDWGKTGGSRDRSTATVRYVEAYLTVDQDGDGIAELVKVCTIGGKIAHFEAVDERPFADFHCDPEPHTFFGESIADKTKDIQFLKSSLMRAGLDSLASAIFPRTVIGPGVNADDVLNNEIGAVIRADRGVEEVKTFETPDVTDGALNWLGYADQVRENRTGMSRVSMGLDAEALQNTTATAAEGQFTRSQERIELIARIMASGFRRLFRGLSHLVAANQREARLVKLRNRWVPIDPRAWRTDMDVQPNVGLGGGSDQHKASVLSMVMQTQAGIFGQYGLQNPFVSVRQYLETAGSFLEMAGFKQPDKFFNSPEQAEQIIAQQQAQAAQQGPPPDPKMVEAQGRMQLAQQQAQGQVQLDQAKAQAGIETERLKIEGQLQLQREEMAQKMALEREQMAGELALKREEMAMEFALQRYKIEQDAKAKMNTDDQDDDVGEVEFGGEPG